MQRAIQTPLAQASPAVPQKLMHHHVLLNRQARKGQVAAIVFCQSGSGFRRIMAEVHGVLAAVMPAHIQQTL